MSATARAIGALILLLLSVPAFAQTPAPRQTPPAVGTWLPADLLADLPVADSVYATIETTQSEIISDRFNSGGLNVGGDARLAGFLGSWSQTLFRVGDIDVTDPSGSGAALFAPNASMWEHVTVDTGLMPASINAPGLAVTLAPRRGGQSWERVFFASGSGGGLTAEAPAGQPVPIARLNNYAGGTARISGPLSDRASIAAGLSVRRGSRFDREQLPGSSASEVTGFANLVFASAADREMRALAVVQHTSRPFEAWHAYQNAASTTGTTSVHLQASLDKHPTDGARWRAFAGFTGRLRSNDIGSRSLLIERFSDGPVPQAVDAAADSTASRLSLGARLTPAASTTSRHRSDFGLDLGSASTATSDTFAGTVTELIDGKPARIWTYAASGTDSRRRTTSIAGYAHDVWTLSPGAIIDASLRAEFVHGNAQAAATSVTWLSLLPRASLRYALGDRRALILGYARSGNALTHNWLAYGDPAASTATVASAAAPGVIVSRVGPGTGGNSAFSGIDGSLKRPTTDEFIIGFEKRRSDTTRYTLTGIARRETGMLAVIPTWTASPYTTVSVSDVGKDYVDPSDDRALLGYNRLASSFGQDRYLVSNPSQKAARAFALRMTWEYANARLFTLVGATASAGQAAGGNRGYGPHENDQDQPGELFTNPNAASYAYGRVFSDRAFTIKWTTRYRLPGDITVGAIARYQDGQPFSRMVVFPSLNQGAEAVQSYPNGGSRFTFTGTLDLRVQKRFAIGSRHADAVFDAYNLFTRSNEVEEYVISAAAFRAPTAIQPPHSIHLGLRFTF